MKIQWAFLPLLIGWMLTSGAEAQTAVKLTLQEAREMAVQNHPRIKAAAMTAIAAEQVPDQLLAERYPNLDMDLTGVAVSEDARIGAGDLTDSSALSRAAAGFNLKQLLFDFGRTGDLVESSRLRANSAKQTTAAVRSAVILEVDRAYFAVLRAQALSQVAVQTADTRRLLLEQTHELQKHGIKSGLDVSVARYNLAESEILIIKSRNDIDAAFASLSAAIGRGEKLGFELAEPPLPAEVMASCEEKPVEALRDREDLRALRSELDASLRFLKAEEGLRKPAVSVLWSSGYNWYRDKGPTPTYNAAGINIRLPLFNGGAFEAREAEAGYKARAADEQLKDAENRIARDVRVACLNANTAYQRIGLAAQLAGRAAETLALARDRYRLGLSSIVELNQALVNLTSAQLESANARFEYLIQRSVLEYQSGQLR